MSYLSPQVIVEQFKSSKLFIHRLGILCLLFLHNLSTCFYHRLYFQLHLTQQLVQFLNTIRHHIFIQMEEIVGVCRIRMLHNGDRGRFSPYNR